MRRIICAAIPATTALIALALGYIACTLAKKEEGILKTAGYIIGVAIIVISSVLIIGKFLWTAKMCVKMCPLKASSISMPAAAPALPKK